MRIMWPKAASALERGFSLDNAADPEICLQCGACRKHCPQKIDIPGAMKDFASLLGRDR